MQHGFLHSYATMLSFSCLSTFFAWIDILKQCNSYFGNLNNNKTIFFLECDCDVSLLIYIGVLLLQLFIQCYHGYERLLLYRQ